MEAILAYAPIQAVIRRGEERISVRLQGELQVDFWFFLRSGTSARLQDFVLVFEKSKEIEDEDDDEGRSR